MKHIKKAFKIALYLILVLVITLLCFYAFNNQELPEGKQGIEADKLAKDMLNAMNYEAYKKLHYIEWEFSTLGKVHKYQWNKKKGNCRVTIDSVTVDLNTVSPNKSSVKVNGKDYDGDKVKAFIGLAESRFNNDSFWLVAPYKLFDNGVERRLVTQQNGENALLITYKSGGSTPGDSYLWHLDKDNRPIAFQMWVKIIPLGGVKATWEDWMTSSDGVFFPKKHKISFLEIEIRNLKVR